MNSSVRYILLLCYFLLPHHLTYFIDGKWPIIKPADIVSVFLLLFIPAKIIIDIFLRKYFYILCVYFIATVFSYNLFGSILVSLKLLQYFVVFIAIQNISFNEQLKIFYAFNVIIGLSFILFLMGFDLGPGMGPRFMGHLVGPYEVAGLSLVSIILLRRENFVKNAKMYKYFSVFIIFATQTKSTMLSLIFSRYRFIVVTFIIVFLCTLFLNVGAQKANDFRLMVLLKDIPTLVSSDIIETCFDMPTFSTRAEYLELFKSRELFDDIEFASASSAQRFVTTCTILSSFTLKSILFGFSPYLVLTVDNSFLRIVSDIGIVGLLICLSFLNEAFAQLTKIEKFAIILTILFSDIFFSSRFLPFVYLWYVMVKQKHAVQTRI